MGSPSRADSETGKITPCGCCCGRSRGRSRGALVGPLVGQGSLSPALCVATQ